MQERSQAGPLGDRKKVIFRRHEADVAQGASAHRLAVRAFLLGPVNEIPRGRERHARDFLVVIVDDRMRFALAVVTAAEVGDDVGLSEQRPRGRAAIVDVPVLRRISDARIKGASKSISDLILMIAPRVRVTRCIE